MLMDAVTEKAIKKIVDSINARNEQHLQESFQEGGAVQKWVESEKAKDYKRSGKAGWVKVASMPPIVDKMYTTKYGADYFKHKEFWDEVGKEWKVIKGKVKNI
jgi:uncharacterized membrane protein YheB (UPF0754 family)